MTNSDNGIEYHSVPKGNGGDASHPVNDDHNEASSNFTPDENWELCYDEHEDQSINETEWPFKCLGYDQGKYFFLAQDSNQIVIFKPASLTPPNLFSLASKDWWYDNFSVKSKIVWETAIDAILRRSHEAGVFNPDQRQRGAGVWRDKKSTVVHCGDKLISGGKVFNAFNFPSYYIYEQSDRRFDVSENSLSDIDAQKLYKICTAITWKNPLSGKILAGWIIMAIICGCLKWRPHLWIMGVFGSGKSFVINDILGRVLAGIAKVLGSGSTEAGIRQKIRHDALPVIMDEMDSESTKDRELIDAILMMSRRSSSGQTIAKGTADGVAQEYNLMSMFCFASINHSVSQGADESRISILDIEKDIKEGAAQRFRDLETFTVETLTPDFSRRLLRRTINNIPHILKNIEIFKRHLRDILHDARAADQIAPFMAGVYLLQREGVISDEQAEKWVKDNNMRDYTATDAEKDHERLFDYLMASKISIKSKNGTHESQIAKAITVALNLETAGFEGSEARSALETIDIRVCPKISNKTEAFIWLKPSSQHIKNLLKGTPWAIAWRKTIELNRFVTKSKEKKSHAIGAYRGPVLMIDPARFENDSASAEEKTALAPEEPQEIPFN